MCLTAYSKVKVQSLRAKVPQRRKELVDEKLETVSKITRSWCVSAGMVWEQSLLGGGSGELRGEQRALGAGTTIRLEGYFCPVMKAFNTRKMPSQESRVSNFSTSC